MFGCAGRPAVLILHGGWGPLPSDATADAGGLIDPERRLVIYFHQRGWGDSSPSGGLERNALDDGVADSEAARRHAGVARWACVYGGPNGATLALAYGAAHPEAVGGGLALRGLWLIRRTDVAHDYLLPDGEARHYPAEDRFAARVGCTRPPPRAACAR